MTPDEAPVGTLCAVGHPMNGNVARKERNGLWFHLSNKVYLDVDAERMLTLLWKPEGE